MRQDQQPRSRSLLVRLSAVALLGLSPRPCSSVSVSVSVSVSEATLLPAPFSRVLSSSMSGSDVTTAQHLLRRSEFARPTEPCCSGVFDSDTEAVVRAVQQAAGLSRDEAGQVGPQTAQYLLDRHTYDGYADDNRTAREQGYKYKIRVPVHSNRSIETTAQLLDADNNLLYTFPVRAHGHDVTTDGQPDNKPWPDYDNDNAGLNEFSGSGATPTGLSQCDLNSPEDDPKLYGPYPIVRVVQGISGNAGFLLPFVRNGILLHTGEWPSLSPTMPNSAGCIHTHPDSLHQVEQLLQSHCGVEVRNNTNGQLPYPYQPQGLISVFQVD